MNCSLVRITRNLILACAVVFLVGMSARADDSATLYKAKCAVCHGPDGKGDTAMGKKLGAHDFTAPDMQKLSDAELTAIINKGKNKMPAYEGKLSKEQIAQLVAYIREIGKKH